VSLRTLRCVAFAVPLASRLTTAALSMTSRRGILLELEADDGQIGLGEISPLEQPPASTLLALCHDLEGIGRAVAGEPPAALSAAVDRWLSTASWLDGGQPAAVAAGIDMAVVDLEARATDVAVARHLCPHPAATVPVNTLVHAPLAEDAAREASDARDAGFTTFKLKVGMATSAAAEVERVDAVRRALGPGPRLRLDANGAWSPDQAVAVIRALEHADIELVEQPVPADDVPGLAFVRRRVGPAIGADEAVTSVASAELILHLHAADVLVVKPMVVGGLGPALRIVELGRNAGCPALVTTTIDTGVGTAATIHLAATLEAPLPACGLATAGMLQSTLVSGLPAVADGVVSVPPGPGLGVSVDHRELGRFALSGRGPWTG
jgi:o-succinylbenzoate synthase